MAQTVPLLRHHSRQRHWRSHVACLHWTLHAAACAKVACRRRYDRLSFRALSMLAHPPLDVSLDLCGPLPRANAAATSGEAAREQLPGCNRTRGRLRELDAALEWAQVTPSLPIVLLHTRALPRAARACRAGRSGSGCGAAGATSRRSPLLQSAAEGRVGSVLSSGLAAQAPSSPALFSFL